MGITVVSDAVSTERCADWLSSIDDAYARWADAPDGAFVRESSSFRLLAIEDLAIDAVWSALGDSLRRQCIDELGSSAQIDADQCWVRRQHPPASAPARHRPHSWHQDGALGYHFLPTPDSAPGDELLRMVTCWIALSPCGVDAPGLELVTAPIDQLLTPLDLEEPAVVERWPAERLRPVMRPGDAVLFSGDVLHRTHCTASMTLQRTSIELRFFPVDAVPDRLSADHFVDVPEGRVRTVDG